ncbi:DUF732 domain-containing protein [Mycobacterium intracellulare]|uniref:DUF732 domain-containing protein n=1 Tax=Mycobacterium intracellulare TaxID=1767 RepID=UPI00080BC158|nr:DUF732 domain-containing protein [Mycobacterium intracellulare]OCB19504.1 hypothetical protein A5644_20135 [Mycobacterium intracellulare subsp. yongonense]
MKPTILVAATNITAAAVLGAPAARADDASYTAALSAAGVPMLGGPGRWVGVGYQVCGQIRNGQSPESASGQFQMLNAWGPAIVSAAQHELCPDTLH